MYRKLITFVSALAFVTLSGCAAGVWTHPTKDSRAFYADSAQCEAVAGQAGGFYDAYGIIRARVYPRCMIGAGWTYEK